MAHRPTQKKGVDFPRRGDAYLVSLTRARGHEIKKTRPALITQNDIGNQYSSITTYKAVPNFKCMYVPVLLDSSGPTASC